MKIRCCDYVQFIKRIKNYLFVRYVKRLSAISPANASRVFYSNRFRQKLNLDNPKNFNEKLMWLKLNVYYENSLITQCTDKYRVREYVASSGYSDILNELLYVWDDVDDIEWDVLPNEFALKCNHGAGYNIICNDKSKLDINRAKKKLKKWMREDYWRIAAEVNYKNIKKRVICEKFINDDKNVLPQDYKVYCLNGEPYIIGNFIERDQVTFKVKRGYFDFEWRYLDVLKDNKIEDYTCFIKPKSLDRIYQIAKDLSKPFPFVRVDFYEVNGRIIFGELTFTPFACAIDYFNNETQLKLGEKLKLPCKTN